MLHSVDSITRAARDLWAIGSRWNAAPNQPPIYIYQTENMTDIIQMNLNLLFDFYMLINNILQWINMLACTHAHTFAHRILRVKTTWVSNSNVMVDTGARTHIIYGIIAHHYHWMWHFIEGDKVTRFICHCITILKFEMVRWCFLWSFYFVYLAMFCTRLGSCFEKNSQNRNGRWSSICDELIFA